MSKWRVSYVYKKLFEVQFRGLKSINDSGGVRTNWITVGSKLSNCSDWQKRLISTHAVIDNMKPGGYLDVSRLGYRSLEGDFKRAIQSGKLKNLVDLLNTYSNAYFANSTDSLISDFKMGSAFNDVADWIKKRKC